MNNYKDLKLWQKSVDQAVNIYEVTKHFPREEIYGITSQLRRSAVSVPSNIAEGSGRTTKNDFRNFLGISHGSSYELETQLIISNRVGFLSGLQLVQLQNDIAEIQKMNWSLNKSLTKDL